jgi:hypothetical protein
MRDISPSSRGTNGRSGPGWARQTFSSASLARMRTISSGLEDALHQFRQPIRLAGRGIDHDGGIAQGARVATGQQRFDRTQAIAGQIVADIVPALIVHAGSPPSTVSYRLSGPRPGQ